MNSQSVENVSHLLAYSNLSLGNSLIELSAEDNPLLDQSKLFQLLIIYPLRTLSFHEMIQGKHSRIPLLHLFRREVRLSTLVPKLLINSFCCFCVCTKRDLISSLNSVFIYLLIWGFRLLSYDFHITMGSWKGRGNQYIPFVRVLYCKLLTNGKQLPAFPLEAMPGTGPRPQRWEARVLPLCTVAPFELLLKLLTKSFHH